MAEDKYDLYLDESGTFMETSTESEEGRKARSQRFPSQLAGVLVPYKSLDKKTAQDILRTIHDAAGRPYKNGDEVHGTKIDKGSEYNKLICGLVAELKKKERWQPVRIANQEGVSYGDRVSTYTNMVAELIVRIFLQKDPKGQTDIRIKPYSAAVLLGEAENGNPIKLEEGEYEKRLTEYLAMTLVRRGYAAESSHWKTEAIAIRSAQKSPQLQICDLLSNASHANYKKLGGSESEVGKALKASFCQYDLTLANSERLERVDQLLAERSFGLALIALAEHLVPDDASGETRKGAEERLHQCLNSLCASVAPVRNAQLSFLLTWLAHLIDLQRSIKVGYNVVCWLLKDVEAPLRKCLDRRATEVAWFSYALQRWALTASNHRGALSDAKKAATALSDLIPSLAGQWEHATLLMEGLVARAVHRTDCFAFEDASKDMCIVADYYEDLSDLFSDAKVFSGGGAKPGRIQSDLRAKALGTWLQSEIYASLQDADSERSERLERARRLSDLAVKEFIGSDDKARQYQYRCQLETVAHEFPTARCYLAQSLGITETSHEAIAEAIQGLGDPIGQGFSLLHWFRLGTASFIADETEEWCNFLNALSTAKLLDDTKWCRGEMTDYPVHGILRYTAIIAAAQSNKKEAQTALGNLRNLGPMKDKRIILGTVQMAAYAEVAALLWSSDTDYARRLLDNKQAERPGLLQLIETVASRSSESFPALWHMLKDWPETIKEVCRPANSKAVRASLLALGRQIGY